MKIISFPSKFKSFLAWLSLGVVIGATITTVYLSNELDELHWTKTELEQQVTQKEERLEKLEQELLSMEEKWEHSSSNVVRDTTIVVDYEDDPQTVLAVEEFCQEIAQEIIGHRISNLEPKLIFQMFDNRTLQVNDNQYRLEVESLLISENLTVWIKPESTENH